DLEPFVVARRRRDVHCGQADLAPARREHDLAVLAAVEPELDRARRVHVRRRPEEVLTDRPVVAVAHRVVAGYPPIEGGSVRGAVTEVAPSRHLVGVLTGGGGQGGGKPKRDE